jgi:hypothetical protein
MRLATVLLSALSILATVGAPVRAATPAEVALEEIWAMEAKIYAGRASGTMQPYVDAVSRNMLSFPFGTANPIDYAGFVESARRFKGDKENNRVFLKGFYLTGGNTAVIFYRAHRTVRPEGTVVDEYWDTTHIYAREDGRWRLMSSINRASDNTDITSSRPPIAPRG